MTIKAAGPSALRRRNASLFSVRLPEISTLGIPYASKALVQSGSPTPVSASQPIYAPAK